MVASQHRVKRWPQCWGGRPWRGISGVLLGLWLYSDSDPHWAVVATLWALYSHPTLSSLHIFALLFLSLRMSVPASAWQDPTTAVRLPPPGRPLGLPPPPRAHLSSLPSLIAVNLVSDPLVNWTYLSPVLCSGRWTVALSALAS